MINRILAAISVCLLAACATTKPTNEMLNQAQSTYESAKMMEGIKNTSAREMDAAKDALQQSKQLLDNGEDRKLVEHYALVALKNTEIAQERFRLKQTRREIDKANEERQRLLLQARTLEAEAAKRELERVKSEAKTAQSEAQQLASQIDELKAENSKRGVILTLKDIVFAFNSADLQPGSNRIVARIAKYLNEYPKRNLLIEGFTDSVGSDEYNLNLSKQRAAAVKEALVGHGVDRQRIETTGLGEAYPVASNASDAGRQQNRRVEVIVANRDGSNVSDR